MEKESNQNTIEITNPEKLREIIEEIKKDGPKQLHILADFDRTLTKAFVGNKPFPSLISILRDKHYLTPDYAPQAQALYDYYAPIEKDPNKSVEEKKEAMEEWWRTHFQLLIKCGLTKDDVKKAVEAGRIEFRPGVSEFIKSLNNENIPLVIMSSSGLGGDAIKISLKNKNILMDNTHIIGNEFVWDRNGKALAVKEPIIHNMNKEETAIQDYPVYQQVKERTNVILLGDNPSDVGMVEGFDYKNLIKIGFLNDNVNKHLENFKKHYDITITNDGTFEYVNNLLDKILNK